ncbi:hypothetical protein [Streptomyces sp. NPDC096030]|uniref:hypothetical protein n=1 Tax=Streptomyces sp. NPDC096030 TaxID=3155423 RepID=UPI00331BA1D6
MEKMLYMGPAQLQGTDTDMLVYVFGDDSAPLSGWRGSAAPAEGGDPSLFSQVGGRECALVIPEVGEVRFTAGSVVGNRRIVITGTTPFPGHTEADSPRD